MSKDPVYINPIRAIVKEIGLQKLSVNQIVGKLHHHNLPKIPSRPVIIKILHDRFGLSYRSFNSAKLHFYQSRFNDKRMWISRLLV